MQFASSYLLLRWHIVLLILLTSLPPAQVSRVYRCLFIDIFIDFLNILLVIFNPAL